MTSRPEPSQAAPDGAGLTAYTLWSVFRADSFREPLASEESAADEFAAAVQSLAADGVVLRGLYDVSGMRAGADLMLWLHAPEAAQLQAALRTLRRTSLLSGLELDWSAMGVHREAEFNKRHTPGFLRDIPPREWLTVYPFVRSYEWYLLPDEERSAMLADHGRKGAAFRGALANTVASFALNDYEWIIPIESDDLLELVDMMRELRYTEARRHVREEVPFYTGRRISPLEAAEVLRS